MDCKKGRIWNFEVATCKVTAEKLRILLFRKPPEDKSRFWQLHHPYAAWLDNGVSGGCQNHVSGILLCSVQKT